MSNSDDNAAGTAGTKAIDYLRSVYQNPLQPDNVRMRAAAIAIEYELPRLAVTATFDSADFAARLDKAVERTRKVAVIEAKPIETNAANSVTANVPSDTKRPHVQVSSSGHKPSVVDRRYRRW